MRDEVTKLPEHFRVKELLQIIENSPADDYLSSTDSERNGDDNYGGTNEGTNAADQFRGTFQRLISSAMENMDGKVTEFVETVVDKVII